MPSHQNLKGSFLQRLRRIHLQRRVEVAGAHCLARVTTRCFILDQYGELFPAKLAHPTYWGRKFSSSIRSLTDLSYSSTSGNGNRAKRSCRHGTAPGLRCRTSRSARDPGSATAPVTMLVPGHESQRLDPDTPPQTFHLGSLHAMWGKTPHLVF